MKANYKTRDLVRTADLKRTLLKGDTANWNYKLYKITESNNDTLTGYRIDNLPERYNEALLKKTQLSLQENISVMKKLNLT